MTLDDKVDRLIEHDDERAKEIRDLMLNHASCQSEMKTALVYIRERLDDLSAKAQTAADASDAAKKAATDARAEITEAATKAHEELLNVQQVVAREAAVTAREDIAAAAMKVYREMLDSQQDRPIREECQASFTELKLTYAKMASKIAAYASMGALAGLVIVELAGEFLRWLLEKK